MSVHRFVLVATATDLRLLPKRDPRRATPIPSSPANRIMPRIFEGNLPRKLSYLLALSGDV